MPGVFCGVEQSVSRVLSPKRGDGHLSRVTVASHLMRPTRGSNEAGLLLPFYLVLHRVGFTELPPSPAAMVSSYLTFSPLPSAVARGLGGVLSVAHSMESLPLGVTQHPAPRSSDFPQTSRRTPATACPARPRSPDPTYTESHDSATGPVPSQTTAPCRRVRR